MKNSGSRLGTILLLMALCAVVAVAVMVFGAHLGLWEPIVGFGYVRNYLNPIGYTVAGLGLAGVVYLFATGKSGGKFKAGVACLLGLGMLTPMLMAKVNPPVKYPPIHDITTDMGNPPEFQVLDDSRAGAKNSLVYGGEEVATQQKAAFPEIEPILSDLSAPEAFAKALEVGQGMGWEIVAQDDEKLTFEATTRTPVYQFVDDVVVRVTAVGKESRVDVRSVSRIGRGDRGVNAQRIREFIAGF